MTERQRMGATIVKLWESKLDTDTICKRLAITRKQYHETVIYFLQLPISQQGDMVRHL